MVWKLYRFEAFIFPRAILFGQQRSILKEVRSVNIGPRKEMSSSANNLSEKREFFTNLLQASKSILADDFLKARSTRACSQANMRCRHDHYCPVAGVTPVSFARSFPLTGRTSYFHSSSDPVTARYPLTDNLFSNAYSSGDLLHENMLLREVHYYGNPTCTNFDPTVDFEQLNDLHSNHSDELLEEEKQFYSKQQENCENSLVNQNSWTLRQWAEKAIAIICSIFSIIEALGRSWSF